MFVFPSYPKMMIGVWVLFAILTIVTSHTSSPFGFSRRGRRNPNSPTPIHSSYPSSLSASSPIQLIARKSKTKKRSSQSSASSHEYESNLVPSENDSDEIPTLDEIRASLGLFGRTIANSVEVGIVTAGSFLSGGILGYGIGGVTGIPKHLLTSSTTTSNLEEPVRRTMTKEIQTRIRAWNGHALTQAGSWAKLSASFSGFHALSRVMRGGKEDKWNGIWGSAATGAYLSRKSGPQAMISSSATYAGITYALDMFFGGGGKGKSIQDEFGFKDAPVEE